MIFNTTPNADLCLHKNRRFPALPPLLGAFTVTSRIRQFFRDESGVTAIEYGILAAAMAAAVGVIFGSDGAFITALRDKFKSIASDITSSGTDIKSSK